MKGTIKMDFDCELPDREGVAYCQVEYWPRIEGGLENPPEGGEIESISATGNADNELSLSESEHKIIEARFFYLLEQRQMDGNHND